MIEYIVAIIVGVVMIIFVLNASRKQNKIKKTGLITEGIVFELLNDASSSFNVRHPVIRFLTLNEQWITETANIGLSPGFYKKGQKVTVIYDPNDPKQFIIDSKIGSRIIYAIIILGSLLILFGTYKLISIEF